jgi:multiple sugar transport system permease protein
MNIGLRRNQQLNRIIKRIIIYIAVIILAVTFIFPFAWMISASFKTAPTVFDYPIKWIPEQPKWENYVEIFQKVNMLTYFKNTIIVSITVTFLQIALASMAAYAFAKIKFPGRDILFIVILATLMIPYQVIMIPLFIIVKNMGLIDTLTGLILTCSFNAFSIFFMKQFFMTIPNELVEAARIDGMSEAGIYFKLIMPLSKPAIASLGILVFIIHWNDFLGPLIILSSDNNLTIQLGIRKFITQYSSDFELIMATSVCAIIPVFFIFIFFQKYFVKGIALTGMKA